MTMQFGKFGGGPYRSYDDVGSPFTDNEKMQLAMSFRDTVNFSQKARAACHSNFSEHHALLKKWFGITPSHDDFTEFINVLKIATTMIHDVLSDSTRIIRFIDSRHTKEVHYSINYIKPLCFHGMYYGEKVEECGGIKRSSTENDFASVHVLCDYFPEERDVSHVGSGMHIHIHHLMLAPITSTFIRSCALYHEMSHIIINTIDTDLQGHMIYGEDRCQRIATLDPWQAINLAECWSYFICYLGVSYE
ncbi:MAG: hypothetical protein KAH18_00070 [Psychromonas sp.]|nr:hypothetical protein [Psychromonas sp.]